MYWTIHNISCPGGRQTTLGLSLGKVAADEALKIQNRTRGLEDTLSGLNVDAMFARYEFHKEDIE